jgi:hypothetical protein
VTLGIDKRYRAWLLLGRGASVLPGSIWAIKCAWIAFNLWWFRISNRGGGVNIGDAETYSTLKELALAILWVNTKSIILILLSLAVTFCLFTNSN